MHAFLPKKEGVQKNRVGSEQAALIDRQTAIIEQLLARNDSDQNREASTPDRVPEEADASLDQGLKSPTIAERKATDQGKDRTNAEQPQWRRAASSENVGVVGGAIGAAGLLFPGTPGLAFGLGGAALAGVSWVQAKFEKQHGKGKA
jgi:hypothetical protein